MSLDVLSCVPAGAYLPHNSYQRRELLLVPIAATVKPALPDINVPEVRLLHVVNSLICAPLPRLDPAHKIAKIIRWLS
jgi:hypothetical protein